MHEFVMKDRVMNAFERLFEPLDFEVRLGVKRLLLQWWPETWSSIDGDDLERLIRLMDALSERLLRHLEAWKTRDGETRLRNDIAACLSYTQDLDHALMAKEVLQKLADEDGEAWKCLKLKHACGFTLEEMIEHTGWTMQQVRTRLNRGKNYLERLIGSPEVVS